MAYAAVVSLKQTIERILNSTVPPSPEIESLYDEIKSVHNFLKTLDYDCSSDGADGELRSALHKLEDLLESDVSDLQEMRRDIQIRAQSVKKLKEDYMNAAKTEDKTTREGNDVSSIIYHGGNESKVLIGLCDELSMIKSAIVDPGCIDLKVVSVLGMAGVGKTALADAIFRDPSIERHFLFRAWVRVGRKYIAEQILQAIKDQLNTDFKGYRGINMCQNAYLIVLDDVWSNEVWDYLKKYLYVEIAGHVIVLTTRLEEVAKYPAITTSCYVHRMRFMNKEESWDLLRREVFGDHERCSPQLEKAGKMIAEKCDGLPLAVVAVARLLSKEEKTPEYWKKVAEKKNSIFRDASDDMCGVLYPSYNYLPQHLKSLFLYMGIYPENYIISYSNLFMLWSTEGLLEPNPSQTSKDFAKVCLEEIVSKSLALVLQRSYSRKIKFCRLHFVFGHLCMREAGKNKFFHILNSYPGSLEEGIESQRRLCIHNSVLLAFKDVRDSMEANCASTARSLLCHAPYHQYPVPISFGARLLKVLDALTIRFYEFPTQVLQLVQLKYLTFTYDGSLPASISASLCNLQYLIVHRHLRIGSLGDWSYLPLEIWYMKELKHLQVTGTCLPFPCDDAALQKLTTLLDVSAHSSTMMFLKRIPNLKKLGIQIELMPDASEPLYVFEHISKLHQLETLRCVVVNPKLIRSRPVVPPPSLSNLPAGLRKLTLSGLGYHWKEMSKIASLPNLTTLKLQCYAFGGPTWETEEGGFQKLNFLSIEETDLEKWTVGAYSFLHLKCLTIKHCYKLRHIPRFFRPFLRRIEVIDCNPSAVDWAGRMRHVDEVHVQSSWNIKS